jgi:hypothetical protein
MARRIRDTRDFWSGVLFLAFGGGAVVLGRRYPFGTTAEMGPGFFPTLLGSLLALMGVIACARSMRRAKAEAHIPTIHWRPVVIVLGSVAIFAIALPALGLVVASMLLLVLSRFAAPEFRWGEVVLFGAALTAACTMVFVWALKMPMLIWPTFIRG